jgi:hypothetical protein
MKLKKKINWKEKNIKKKTTKQSIRIVLCEEGYNKIPSWDHNNLMKSKQNES